MLGPSTRHCVISTRFSVSFGNLRSSSFLSLRNHVPTKLGCRPLSLTSTTRTIKRQQSRGAAMTISSPASAGREEGQKIDILLIGLGSVGTVYAYMLEKSGLARVTAVCRSNYPLYSTTGVTIDSDKFGKVEGWKPYRVVKSQAEAFKGDTHYAICVLCTKCVPDVLPTSRILGDAIASGKVGAWSLLQNGLEIEQELYEAVKHLNTPIISSCLWLGAMPSVDGSVVHWRGREVCVSGLYPPLAPVTAPQTRQYSPRELEALELWRRVLVAGGSGIHIEDRIDSIRFAKNIWNCVWSSIQSLTRTTSEPFAYVGTEQQDSLKRFIREVVDTGFASGLLHEGMTLYPNHTTVSSKDDFVAYGYFHIELALSKGPGKGHRMSMVYDVEAGRPFELEVITGAVLRLAKAHKVDTPLLAFAYTLLKGVQVQNAGQAHP